MFRFKFFRLWVLILFLPSFVSANKNSSSTKRLTEMELKKELHARAQKYGVAGFAFAVVSKNKTLFRYLSGFSNIAKKQPITEKTIFRVGNLSQTFVALAFLKLQEEGKLRLWDKVSSFVSPLEWKNSFEAKHPLKIVHLLEQTSGFDDIRFNEYYAGYNKPLVPIERVLATNDRARVSRFVPGQFYGSSPSHFSLAASVLEKATRTEFSVWMKKNVFLPLSLKFTDFSLSEEMEKNLAIGYIRGQKTNQAVPYQAVLHYPAKGLHSSLEEMEYLLQFFLHKGKNKRGKQWIKSESFDRLGVHETSVFSSQDKRWGHALGLENFRLQNTDWLGQRSLMDGFASQVFFSVSKGLGFAFLWNTLPSPRIQRDLQDIVVQFYTQDSPPLAPLSKKNVPDLSQWLGNYRMHHIHYERFFFLLRDLSWLRIEKSSKPHHLLFRKMGLWNWSSSTREVRWVGKSKLRETQTPSFFLFAKKGNKTYLSNSFGAVFVRDSERNPFGLAWGLMFFVCVSFLGFCIHAFWVIAKMVGKLPHSSFFVFRFMPWMSLFSILSALFLLSGVSHLETLSFANPRTIAFSCLTGLFPIFSLGGLVLGGFSFGKVGIHPFFRGFVLFWCGINLWMSWILWPIVGIQLWR